jgi:hypothetical protein
VAVEQVLSGDLTAAQITLKEPGGSVGGEEEVLFGAPSFLPGERVVLFLTAGADGTLRTNQLSLGKFRIEDRVDGTYAVQDLEGATVVAAPGSAPLRTAIPLAELINEVRATPPSGEAVPDFLIEPPVMDSAPVLEEYFAPFTLLGSPPGRFFEVDEGASLSYLIHSSGDTALGSMVSHQAIFDAFDAWSMVPTAAVNIVSGGPTDDLSTPCAPGEHKVLFNDPFKKIPNPKNCKGILGVGGFCSNPNELKRLNGTTFSRAIRATLTMADGWGGCLTQWTACNFAEIATHEVGHSIGMGHSEIPAATMYYLNHNDGRCASLHADDSAGVTHIYPTTTPVTITTASPLPGGIVSMPYSQPLSATGGTGPYTFTLGSGSVTVPGLATVGGGTISGTPSFAGLGIYYIVATDTLANFHRKQFEITVGTAHDTVVLPVNPLTVTIPAGKAFLNRTVSVRVRNADNDFLGHRVQLTATSGDCPSGTIAGLPDFKPSIGSPDSILLGTGKTKVAKVPLRIASAAFSTFNRKAPTRCTITFTADIVGHAGNVDPNPSNNSVSMELNVIDRNDAEMSAVHESVIKSVNPITITIPDAAAAKGKTVGGTVTNADFLPTVENPGHLISLASSDGDCPLGTVSMPDFDAQTPGFQTSKTVKGGASAAAKLTATATAVGFSTPNSKSPIRCTAVLTSSGPGGDTDGSNNTTNLVIDVIDKNDF